MKIKHRKQILLAQMLPHTWIGHPVASVLTFFGFEKAADDFHYFTLPPRAKRRVKQADIPWINSNRLYFWDMVIVPVYALLDTLGFFEAGEAVCRFGPWKTCLELGACYSVDFRLGKICKHCDEAIGSAVGGWRGMYQSNWCQKSPTQKHEPR